jgi:transcriptional regulator with XRE-family HTH domain
MYNPISVGERIRDLRKKANLTQEELAEQLNISSVSMCRIETGNKGASIDLLVEISKYFKTSMDYLLFGRKISDIEVILSDLPQEKRMKVMNIMFAVVENI